MKKKKKPELEDLESTVEALKQRFGEGAIMKLGEVKPVDVEALPTGSLSLDLALGIGGAPKGRIIEIFGPESSGKTTLALHLIAEAQKRGGVAAFVDAEHALDPDYAKRLGVDVENILISQPESAEQALDIVEALVRSGQVSVVVVDSVAALTPRAEIEGEMGEQQIALQARLMSQALRKLTHLASKYGTTIVFLNQTRMKIGGIGFASPETTPGGKALKFYSSVRIQLKPIAKIKRGDEVVGTRVQAKVVKNKVAPPFHTAEFDVYYNEGISEENDLLNTGLKYGVIEKSGKTFTFKDIKLGVGLESARKFLKENPQIKEEVKKEIIKRWQEKK